MEEIEASGSVIAMSHVVDTLESKKRRRRRRRKRKKRLIGGIENWPAALAQCLCREYVDHTDYSGKLESIVILCL